jgi:hypothetical protein
MINTFSIFYTLEEVTSVNQNLPFDEGAGEVNGVVDVGNFTNSQIPVAVETALNASSITRVFTVSFDRDTRLITISADGIFDLLISTGSTAGSSIFQLLGFTGAVDLTGLTSYTSDSPIGDFYEPQFKFQSYVDESNFREFNNPSVSESASGKVEVVSFGLKRFFEMDIKFITNLPMDNKVIKNNANGLADAQRFLRFITTRNNFEFMPDIDTRSTFFKVNLETIRGNSTATGYKLKELFTQNLPDIYETGVIGLRIVE